MEKLSEQVKESFTKTQELMIQTTLGLAATKTPRYIAIVPEDYQGEKFTGFFGYFKRKLGEVKDWTKLETPVKIHLLDETPLVREGAKRRIIHTFGRKFHGPLLRAAAPYIKYVGYVMMGVKVASAVVGLASLVPRIKDIPGVKELGEMTQDMKGDIEDIENQIQATDEDFAKDAEDHESGEPYSDEGLQVSIKGEKSAAIGSGQQQEQQQEKKEKKSRTHLAVQRALGTNNMQELQEMIDDPEGGVVMALDRKPEGGRQVFRFFSREGWEEIKDDQHEGASRFLSHIPSSGGGSDDVKTNEDLRPTSVAVKTGDGDDPPPSGTTKPKSSQVAPMQCGSKQAFSEKCVEKSEDAASKQPVDNNLTCPDSCCALS